MGCVSPLALLPARWEEALWPRTQIDRTGRANGKRQRAAAVQNAAASAGRGLLQVMRLPGVDRKAR